MKSSYNGSFFFFFFARFGDSLEMTPGSHENHLSALPDCMMKLSCNGRPVVGVTVDGGEEVGWMGDEQ